MLIIPLHRRLSAAHFPFVTAALVVINAFVFFALQSGDGRAADRAFDAYRGSAVSRVEAPLYRTWMNEHGHAAQAATLEAMKSDAERVRFELIQSDAAFQRELRADRLITPDNPNYAEWKAGRETIDAAWNARITDRYVLRYGEFAPKRILGSMFLHGGMEHLIGNMVFLILLGLLVEGALGPGLFLAVYLLGGIGGQLATLAWHWGDAGTLLGASGAIAGLMGAYCVLWGSRKVRFFWWFFVVFNYVRAPALVLLPLWLGWEVLNMAFNPGSQVSFVTHAGGIVSGALLAWGIRALHWERADFLDEDLKEDSRAATTRDLKTAMDLLGALEIPRARSLLQDIDEREPGQMPVRMALYRCARYANDMEATHATALAALKSPQHAIADVRMQKQVFDDYFKASAGEPKLVAPILLRLAQDAVKLGADADAEKLLRLVAEKKPALPGLVEAWFALSQRAAASPIQRKRLRFIAETFAGHALAERARFLLAQN